MARKKADSGGGGGSEWLNTYADMVTLLLTFFVLLYSMSTMNAAKFNMMVSALRSDVKSDEDIVIMGSASGNAEGLASMGPDSVIADVADMDSVYGALKEAISQAQKQDSVEISKGDGYIFIRFMDDMLFEPNSSRLKPTDLELLNFIGYGIKSIQNEVTMISINGHTAAIPENPNYPVSDRLLSTDRANAVLMHFEDQIGIAPEKLLAIGWGKQKPLSRASNDTEEGRSRNRRVEILINSENVIGDQLENVYERLVD